MEARDAADRAEEVSEGASYLSCVFVGDGEFADRAFLADSRGFDAETVKGHVDVEGGAEGVVA